ncbi:MAG: TonB-dependent receptor [Acidobacteriota bacterium]
MTRSGGNQFSGTLDARYRNQSFQQSGDHYDTSELDTSFQRYSATLGGPILRDRMWFFAAYEWTSDSFTPNGSPTTQDDTAQNYLAKITWQIDPSWRLTAKYSGAPTNTDNFAASQFRAPEATAHGSSTNSVLSAELSSVLSDSLLWNTTLGLHRYDTATYPQSGDLQTIGHYNYDTGISSHNYGNQQYWGSDRNDFTTDLTWFVDDLAGSHEFKGGIEYSGVALPDEGLCSTGTPNGERCAEHVPGFFFYDIEYGGAFPLFMLESLGLPPEDYTGQVSTAFVQDAWRVTGDLTLKIGLRYDGVTYDNNEGAQVIDMAMWQPRLGVAWDLTGDAKNILRGSWGRFQHPGKLSGVAFATTARTADSFWYSCSGAVPLYFGISVDSAEACAAAAADLGFPYRMDNEGWDPFGWMLPPWEIYGSEPTVIADGLRATYADELILAYERAVGQRSSIEISYVDKKTRDIYDDTCNGNLPTPMEGADCSYYVIANVPGLQRDYHGFIVRYETRGLSWLTLLASYTYSSSKGSDGYTQNANQTADIYPWHFENRYGYLDDHRAHRLKLNGYFNITGNWTIAFDTFWASPFTWAPYENGYDNPEVPYGGHFLEPRGSREANSNYQLDLQLTKGFQIGQTRLELIGSVFNVFNSEQPTAVCSHISGCGQYEMGEPGEWQIPRRYEAGLRLEF